MCHSNEIMVEIRPNDVLLNDIFVVCMDWIGFEKFAKVKKVLQLAPGLPYNSLFHSFYEL